MQISYLHRNVANLKIIQLLKPFINLEIMELLLFKIILNEVGYLYISIYTVYRMYLNRTKFGGNKIV